MLADVEMRQTQQLTEGRQHADEPVAAQVHAGQPRRQTHQCVTGQPVISQAALQDQHLQTLAPHMSCT